MKTITWAYLFYLLLIVKDSLQVHQRWAWSWSCEFNRCIRSEFTKPEKDVPIKEHEAVCKLLCDERGLFWPMPTGNVVLSTHIIQIHPDKITFDLLHMASDAKYGLKRIQPLIENMTKMFKGNIKKLCHNEEAVQHAKRLHITIKTSKPDLELNWQTDESYTLNVTTIIGSENYIMAAINAHTIFGARHGLQTLYQMIVTYSVNKQCHLVMPENGFIKDKPAYAHRGLLVDSSRHYLPLTAFKRILDAMAQAKLNVLHWHATDSQSFPINFRDVPQLSRNGAYSFDEIYNVQDIDDIIRYAKYCGVRVIMEIDGPSHAGFGWQFGNSPLEQVVCLNKQPYNVACIEPPCGQLNPANEATYKVLSKIYRELFQIFEKENVFHVGGDEVFIPCWRSSADIRTFLYKMGRNTTDEDFLYLWGEYQKKLLRMIDEISPNEQIHAILWSSQLTDPKHIDKYLINTRYVIQTWVDSTNTLPVELMKKGYKVIISTKDAWYLDHGFWGITKYHQWPAVYNNMLPSNTNMVLGGEVLMWGEYVDDNVIDGRIWPRASAAAERLWTNPTTKALEAEERFLFHRNRLVKLGIKAEPITSQFCEQNSYKCTRR